MITFVTPANDEEMAPHLHFLTWLRQFYPGDVDHDLSIYAPNLTIIYFNRQPFGAFSTWLFKRSAEIHGVVRQDWPERGAIARMCANIILNDIFVTHNKQVCVIKPAASSKGGRGFAILHGFKPFAVEDGAKVYKLTKQEYFKRAETKG